MKPKNHSNALLIELLIVVFFFMISATVLLRLFSEARSQSKKAEILAAATVQAQNVAEQLYASNDREEKLLQLGFAGQEDGWTLLKEDYTILVQLKQEQTTGGTLFQDAVIIEMGGETLLTLPCFRYEEVAA